jgi:hypothetical protein
MNMRKSAMAAAVAALMVMPVASACSGGGDDDVVTLQTGGDESGETSTYTTDQGRRAEAFYNCQVDAGLPATIEDQGDGQAYVGWDTTKFRLIKFHSAEGWGYPITGDSMSEADLNDLYDNWDEAFYGDPSATLILIVDDADRSEDYGACLTSSGYTEPEYHADPAEELKTKQAQVDANNAWAACARENGFPNLEDNPAAVADEWQTFPEGIVLPYTIGPDKLRELLEACPNFDEERVREQADPAFDWDSYDYEAHQYEVDPSITFDFPWMDSDAEWTEDQMKQSDELWAVLYEKQEAIYSELNEGGDAAIAVPAPAVRAPAVG